MPGKAESSSASSAVGINAPGGSINTNSPGVIVVIVVAVVIIIFLVRKFNKKHGGQ